MTSEPQLTNRATRRRRRTHLDLLGSLRRELAQSGVEDLTVGSVTDRADVAVGTFYNHFDDKTSALESLAQIEAEALEISVLDMIERSNDPSPTLPRLVNAMALSVMHRRRRPRLARRHSCSGRRSLSADARCRSAGS